MGPINTVPLGFLDLLGLNQQGRNLAEVAESIAGTLDMLPYYAAFKRTFVRDDAAFAAAPVATTVVATVPVGEYWMLQGGVIQSSSPAGGTGRGGVQIQMQGRVVFSSEYISLAAADAGDAKPLIFGNLFPIVLAPGDAIWKFGYGLTAGEQINARVVYTPLKG